MANSNVPYFKAWLIYTIGTIVLAFFAGMAVGAVLGFVMGIIGVPIETIRLVGGLVGMAFGITVSYIMFRWAVEKYIVSALSASPGTNN